MSCWIACCMSQIMSPKLQAWAAFAPVPGTNSSATTRIIRAINVNLRNCLLMRTSWILNIALAHVVEFVDPGRYPRVARREGGPTGIPLVERIQVKAHRTDLAALRNPGRDFDRDRLSACNCHRAVGRFGDAQERSRVVRGTPDTVLKLAQVIDLAD